MRMLMATACLGFVLSGCGARWAVDEPSHITLENALDDVGKGLAKLHASQPEGKDFGVFPAEITVTFNVTAGGTGNSKLVVAPFTAEAANIAAGRLSGEFAVSETASRGNTVTVKFINLLFAPEDTLIRNTTGEKLYNLRLAVHGEKPLPDSPPASGAATPQESMPHPTQGTSQPTREQPSHVRTARPPQAESGQSTPEPPPPQKPQDEPTQPRTPGPQPPPGSTKLPPIFSVMQEEFDSLSRSQLLQLYDALKRANISVLSIDRDKITEPWLRQEIVRALKESGLQPQAVRIAIESAKSGR